MRYSKGNYGIIAEGRATNLALARDSLYHAVRDFVSERRDYSRVASSHPNKFSFVPTDEIVAKKGSVATALRRQARDFIDDVVEGVKTRSFSRPFRGFDYKFADARDPVDHYASFTVLANPRDGDNKLLDPQDVEAQNLHVNVAECMSPDFATRAIDLSRMGVGEILIKFPEIRAVAELYERYLR